MSLFDAIKKPNKPNKAKPTKFIRTGKYSSVPQFFKKNPKKVEEASELYQSLVDKADLTLEEKVKCINDHFNLSFSSRSWMRWFTGETNHD